MNEPELEKRTFKLQKQQLNLSDPVVMGILNLTPDSFSDGGLFLDPEIAIDRIDEMVDQGAQIIDVGGESTRPGSKSVSVEDEMQRVIPVIERAISQFPKTLFSIDTTKYEVAEAALKLGVHIVNDVSGLTAEPGFVKLCAEHNAGYILMHSQGSPETMQDNPKYTDVVEDIIQFFCEKLETLNRAGIDPVFLDPGIGFGKTLQHNLQIIARLNNFAKLGYPLLVGASRKSMVSQILDGRPVDGRLAGTLAVHYHCLLKGASLLRVHDVKEALDSVKVFTSLKDIN